MTLHSEPIAPQSRAADRTSIAEIMSPTPITVHPELELDDLMTLFLEHDISHAPVVDEHDVPIGMVSKTDLVVDQYVRGDTVVDQGDAGGYGRHVHGGTAIVRDVMSPILISLPASASIGTAARHMLADHVHAIPVTSPDGRVIGILSTVDVLAWVAGL